MIPAVDYTRVAVNAIIFDGSRRVLLTRRRDMPIWCLPGGHLEVGETLSAATRRETAEEVAVEIAVVRVTGVYSRPNVEIVAPARHPVLVVAFECSMVSGDPQCSDEVEAVEFFDVARPPTPVIESHLRRARHAYRPGAPVEFD